MAEERDYPYEEIDLFEYLMVLKRRWKVVIGVTALALLAAGLLSFLMPKVYEIKAAISTGLIGISSTGEPISVVPPEDLAAIIKEKAFNKEISEIVGIKKNGVVCNLIPRLNEMVKQ